MGITDVILPGRANEPGTDGALTHQQSLTPTDEPNAIELFANSTSLTDLIEKINNQQTNNFNLQQTVPSNQTQTVNSKQPNGNNRMDGVQPLIVGQPVIAGSLANVNLKRNNNGGNTKPKLHRQDSLEPFAKIATTTDDALSQITPTLGFATPEPVSSVADDREQLTALSGVQHDHHSLHAASGNDATDSMLGDTMLSGSVPTMSDPHIGGLPYSSFSENDLTTTDNSLTDGQPPPLVKLEPGLNEGSLLGDDDWLAGDDKSLLSGLSPDVWPAPLNGGSILPPFSQTYIKKDSGPTLAELNLSGDLWDSIDVDELLASSNSLIQPSYNGNYPMKLRPIQPMTNEKENVLMNSYKLMNSHMNGGSGGSNSVPVTPDTEANINLSVDSKPSIDNMNHQQEHLNTLIVNPVNSSRNVNATAPNVQQMKPIATRYVTLPPTLGQQVVQSIGQENTAKSANQINQSPNIQILQVPQSVLAAIKQNTTQLGVQNGDLKSNVLGSLLNTQNQNLVAASSKPVTSGVKRKAAVSFPTTLLTADTSKPNKRQLTDENNRIRNSSMSSDGQASVSSHDEGFGSENDGEEESDDDDDNEELNMGDDSDDESFYGEYEAKDLLNATTSDDVENRWALNMGRSRKGGAQRYFWQYNVQSKGPKGARLSAESTSDVVDPHVLQEAADPVFSEDCRIEGVKHAGKARRGDGNDLTPNPRKLLMIGLELKKLSKIINDLTPVAEVPMNARNKTRKEKNKLASRACRLKKKAQHEANKIKLYGLHQEHRKYLSVLTELKKQVKKQVEIRKRGGPGQVPLLLVYEQVVASKQPIKEIATKTTDFVNSVLDAVAAGQTNGGLEKV